MSEKTKTIKPDNEILAVMVTCVEVKTLDDGRMAAKVDERLARPFYKRTEAIFDEMGGRWDNSIEATVFPPGVDLNSAISQLLDKGSIEIKFEMKPVEEDESIDVKVEEKEDQLIMF